VADFYGHFVSVVDLAEKSIFKRIPVGHYPAGLAVNSDGSKIYVAEREDNTVSVINGLTLTIDKTGKVSQHPFGLLLDENDESVSTWRMSRAMRFPSLMPQPY
jgi:YVTN family beta-propeller protein